MIIIQCKLTPMSRIKSVNILSIRFSAVTPVELIDSSIANLYGEMNQRNISILTV